MTLTLITLALFCAGTATARDQRDRDRPHERRDQVTAHAQHRVTSATLHDARRLDHRLDRRGRRIDAHYNFAALIAAFAGHYEFAVQLDRHGDRLERRYDRIGDRALRDARGHGSHRHDRGCGHGADLRHSPRRHDTSHEQRRHTPRRHR